MTECETFSSLFALVDSHLSKISLQESQTSNPVENSEETNNASRSDEIASNSNFFSPGKVLPIPKFGLSESPISSVLANQVANMLLAKEKRQENERKGSIEEESPQEEIEEENMHEDIQEESNSDNEYLIDLTQALIQPGSFRLQTQPETVRSCSSSCESLFKLKDEDLADKKTIKLPEVLPCVTDMTYILSLKLQKGECSPFAKVLTSKLREYPACYFPEKINFDIKRFSFTEPSPCDLIMEKLRRPTMSCTQIPNIFE